MPVSLGSSRSWLDDGARRRRDHRARRRRERPRLRAELEESPATPSSSAPVGRAQPHRRHQGARGERGVPLRFAETADGGAIPRDLRPRRGAREREPAPQAPELRARLETGASAASTSPSSSLLRRLRPGTDAPALFAATRPRWRRSSAGTADHVRPRDGSADDHPGGPKAFVKRLLGRPPYGVMENQRGRSSTRCCGGPPKGRSALRSRAGRVDRARWAGRGFEWNAGPFRRWSPPTPTTAVTCARGSGARRQLVSVLARHPAPTPPGPERRAAPPRREASGLARSHATTGTRTAGTGRTSHNGRAPTGRR